MMKMLIDDEFVDTGEKIAVENPATNEAIDHVPLGREDEVGRAVGSASKAFREWKRESIAKRRKVLLRIAQKMDEHADELARILVKEVGKPLAEARHEVRSSSNVFKGFAALDIRDTVVKNDGKALVFATHHPIGVAALILPWNYPLSVLSWKLAPALLAGNTVVVKPSPYTPLNALHLGEITRSILPKGVVNILTGDDETGKLVVRSDDIDKIAFTGQVDTGKEIMKFAAGSLKRVSLELGGNDPAIVLKDFDMKQLPSLFWSSFRNAGQICIAVKRLYVHENLFEEFVRRYSGLASEVIVGNGMVEGVQMGPVNNREQLALVENLVKDASERGGRIVTGGKRGEGVGYFYPPTVITDIEEQARIVIEEQFGPVVPIIPYSDEEEAIQKANSLRYGLGASVWTTDNNHGLSVANELESGTAWINTHMVVDPMAPFGGVKESGIGRELGIWGFNEYVNLQTVYLKK